jgi:hypothetical protein
LLLLFVARVLRGSNVDFIETRSFERVLVPLHPQGIANEHVKGSLVVAKCTNALQKSGEKLKNEWGGSEEDPPHAHQPLLLVGPSAPNNACRGFSKKWQRVTDPKGVRITAEVVVPENEREHE